MADYNFTEIEKKWVKFWDDHKTFKVTEDPSIPEGKRLYVLDMFPYPSGSGLHVGHPEGYTATDIYTRFKRMNGFNVLHPMGWDAFGLPAENHAIETGTHPADETNKNINSFRRQIKSIGFCYDWDREVSTCDADYYKWTQWIFLKLFERGLAYESDMPINFCPKCGTGLANEEVNNGCCDRCDTPIERRRLKQWMLKITAYAERLLNDLDKLDWNESVKLMQRNWIGKSEGAEVHFKVDGSDKTLTVFTTRPDTLFGATYMVVAPEHPMVKDITTASQRAAVENYIAESNRKSDLQRTDLNKDKSGVFTGSYAINPVNGKRIPIWTADYVLMGYGTGAIMAVPAHDTRDFEFATKFKLDIIEVVSPTGTPTAGKYEQAFTEQGIAVNSGEFNGLKTAEFKEKITKFLEAKKLGKKMVNYKLRDWVFSRQRYWGEPIPIVHCLKCGKVGVDEKELPLTLPNVKSYKPSGTGESPLATMTEWINTKCPKCHGPAKRESNTMPQWAGSSWYFFRFADPKNTKEFASQKALDYWLPVDLYIGGTEHAVLHLLYARFWTKVLYDLGLVKCDEPFMTLRNQGMILGTDGEKMSKSKGNGVNPDDVIRDSGADALRIYEMFMGPLWMSKPWSSQGITGVVRFLERFWRLFDKPIEAGAPVSDELDKVRHKTIKMVGEKIDALEFNVAVSQMMIFANALQKEQVLNKDVMKDFVKVLHPFAPFITEELWERLGEKSSVLHTAWPNYDEAKTHDEVVTIVFSVNGKARSKADVEKGMTEDKLIALAMADEKVAAQLAGKTIVKQIVVPDRIVNIVVK